MAVGSPDSNVATLQLERIIEKIAGLFRKLEEFFFGFIAFRIVGLIYAYIITLFVTPSS